MINDIQEEEYCKVRVLYTAETSSVLEKQSKIVNEIQEETKKIPIKGYRPGRAPLTAIKSRFKKQIEERVTKDLVAEAYDDILFETKIKPIFYPQVSSIQLNGSHFSCEMLFLKKPTFELKQYKDFEIPKPHMEKTIGDMVEEMCENIRTSFADVIPYDEKGFVEAGDKITMDVRCEVDGETIDLLTKEGMLYTVGQGFFQDFDDNILGMKPGEERKFDVLWDPATNQKANLSVKLHMGTKTVKAALDDELAKKLDFENLNALRSQLEGVASNQIMKKEEAEINQQIISRILENHPFEAPQSLVSLEFQQILAQHKLDSASLDDETKAKITELAKNQVRLSIIMDSIREAEIELDFNSEELMNIMKKRASDLGMDPNKFLVEAQASGQLFGLVARLQHELTLTWLREHSKIVE